MGGRFGAGALGTQQCEVRLHEGKPRMLEALVTSGKNDPLDIAYAAVIEAASAKFLVSKLGCDLRPARRYHKNRRVAAAYRDRLADALEPLAKALLSAYGHHNVVVRGIDHEAMVSRADARADRPGSSNHPMADRSTAGPTQPLLNLGDD